jgi:hypothetical protein
MMVETPRALLIVTSGTTYTEVEAQLLFIVILASNPSYTSQTSKVTRFDLLTGLRQTCGLRTCGTETKGADIANYVLLLSV